MDREARFRAVFDAAYAPLCRYVRNRGLTGADAEDLVAQTLEIAWRRIDDVPMVGRFPGCMRLPATCGETRYARSTGGARSSPVTGRSHRPRRAAIRPVWSRACCAPGWPR